MREAAHLLGLTALAIVALLSFYGWGALCVGWADRKVRSGVVTVALGLCAVVFLVGVLNLLRLAYGVCLDVLLLLGVALALRLGRAPGWLPPLAAIPIVLIMLFTAQTQLPPRSFNWHDDYEKYFAHPVRMLQMGTLFGSPLNALGSETLGAMAGLHAMLLNHLPIPYINGVDAGFGLLLSLLLPVSALPSRLASPMQLAAPLLVFAIEPQYVNVSALYLAAALMMTSVLLVCDPTLEGLPPSSLLGLVYAALVALKSSYALFPILHLPLLCIGFALSGREAALRWGARTAGWGLLFLAPWVLLHAPHYARFSIPEIGAAPPVNREAFPGFWSTNSSLSYGATFAAYTGVAVAAALAAGAAAGQLRRHSPRLAAGVCASAVASVAAYLLLLALGPAMSGYGSALRYAIPFLIGGGPVLLALAHALWRASVLSTAPVLLTVVCLAGFAEPLGARVARAYTSGSILAFAPTAANPVYQRYSEDVLYGGARARLAAAQAAVPPGQPLVAWVSTPFYLEYRRNIVYDAERSGISSPWAHVPTVDYFVIEYRGLAVRPPSVYEADARDASARERHIGRSCLAFLRFLQGFRASADLVYDDGGIAVLKRRKAGPP